MGATCVTGVTPSGERQLTRASTHHPGWMVTEPVCVRAVMLWAELLA